MFLSILLFFSANSFADTYDVKVHCGNDEQAGVKWKFCEYKVPGSNNDSVLYYLHGLRGDEYEWQNSPNFVKTYGLWGFSAPTVVTLSYGSTWLLAEKNNSPRSGLYEHFTQIALPAIEKRLNLKPQRRLLMGASMGGFNASQVYLKNPELFAKVSLACPAITSIGPYDSAEVVAAYQERTGAYDEYVRTALTISAAYFPDQASWDKSAPIAQATERVQASHPPLYVSGGTEDEFGFQEGGELFAKAARDKGAQVVWKAVPGLHCSFDVIGNAIFLLTQ
ncbi:MAG: esterase [Bdellovibrionales bacterium]|nr:esterase [Oligoflexia bacterium]